MGPVDESGAAKPVKPEADAAESSAPEIKVETTERAAHRNLDDDKAPILYVPAARQRFGRAAVLAIAIALWRRSLSLTRSRLPRTIRAPSK